MVQLATQASCVIGSAFDWTKNRSRFLKGGGGGEGGIHTPIFGTRNWAFCFHADALGNLSANGLGGLEPT